MKLALRAGLVAVVAAVAAQTGAAAPARMRLVTTPDSFLLWTPHDGLLGVGRCDVGRDVHEGLCVGGAVERTTDGGHTYRVVLRTKKPVGSLRTVGANGAVATTYGNQTWLTLDRGRTWRHVPSSPVVYWLTARLGVSFLTSAVHNRERLALRVTHDAGATWQRQRDPCTKSTLGFNAFADLVTPKLWWVACLGEGGAGNEEKAIFRTRDGGKTWQAGAATLAYPKTRVHGGIAMYGYPEQLALAADGFGLLTESRGALYVTRDGGAHFHVALVARPELDFAGGAAAFRGGVAYVLLTQAEPRLVVTRDFGRTWQVVRRWPTR